MGPGATSGCGPFDGPINATAQIVDSNGTPVGITALAEDADGTDGVNYSLDDDAGGRFTIDPAPGVVTVANGDLLDYEAATGHAVTVRATSTNGSFSGKAMTIDLTDVNDSAPAITAGQGFAVAEDAADGAVVGTVAATDADTVGSLQGWTISAGNGAGIFGHLGLFWFRVAGAFQSSV